MKYRSRHSVGQANMNVLRCFYLNFCVVSTRHLTGEKYNRIFLKFSSLLQIVKELHACPA